MGRGDDGAHGASFRARGGAGVAGSGDLSGLTVRMGAGQNEKLNIPNYIQGIKLLGAVCDAGDSLHAS